MFGGTNYIDNIPIAFKLDLLQNKWFKLPSTSVVITHCSMEIFKNSIIISGRHVSNIFKYDLNIESHSDLYLEDLDLDTYKGIFSGGSRLYIFQNSNFIYESEIDNDYEWNKIGNFNYEFSMFPFKKFNDGSVFISLSYKAKLMLYKFDLKHKNFKKLKDIKGK
ncbi:unnamed protein product [Blepharisma stoltei]|uniref:Uncharacterized protein n=1 Tax=Blepharisma stoltei TaxID=1481888 RepID=A0AAU9K358_9CILI|nr:unnamed protein product [Blepharisma stoltei]